ncbi:hypothetical protein LOAG_13890 [Loa loa]|uniref:Uncharacterized protein n=1 Tax=Loa loa TaxID=7209 RepID=A0A1S0TIM3_LOALO|nr:hypothetical protein LOAG_13890 [Loa loa]EFO14626.1 hypothetical protein LOAG_13890 [Loa loa]
MNLGSGKFEKTNLLPGWLKYENIYPQQALTCSACYEAHSQSSYMFVIRNASVVCRSGLVSLIEWVEILLYLPQLHAFYCTKTYKRMIVSNLRPGWLVNVARMTSALHEGEGTFRDGKMWGDGGGEGRGGQPGEHPWVIHSYALVHN